jgi:hypothetical protein
MRWREEGGGGGNYTGRHNPIGQPWSKPIGRTSRRQDPSSVHRVMADLVCVCVCVCVCDALGVCLRGGRRRPCWRVRERVPSQVSLSTLLKSLDARRAARIHRACTELWPIMCARTHQGCTRGHAGHRISHRGPPGLIGFPDEGLRKL